MCKGRRLFRFGIRFSLWLGFPCRLPNRVNNPAICISPSRSICQDTAFKSLRQRFSVPTDGCQALVKKWIWCLQKTEQHMNRLYRTARDFRKVSPGNECCPQIGMPVKWARRGFAFFAKALAQSAAEFGGLGFSSGQGIPDCMEILSNL